MPSGKYWCWVHWDLEIPVFDMLISKELLVRAWDSSMNTQPAVITWNLTGMMNNCYHRCGYIVDASGVGEDKMSVCGLQPTPSMRLFCLNKHAYITRHQWHQLIRALIHTLTISQDPDISPEG